MDPSLHLFLMQVAIAVSFNVEPFWTDYKFVSQRKNYWLKMLIAFFYF